MYGLGLVSTLKSSLILFIYATLPISTLSFVHFFPLSSFIFPNEVLNSCENTEIKRTRKEKTKAIKKKKTENQIKA